MRKRIGTFFVIALAFALFAAPVQAGDGKVKGLWLEIPGLPEASSTTFNIQSDGEGEAYFERDFDGLIEALDELVAKSRSAARRMAVSPPVAVKPQKLEKARRPRAG